MTRTLVRIAFAALLLLPFAARTASAQTTPADSAKKADSLGWQTKTKIGANFSQSYLSNWAAGGKNTLLITGLGNFSADYIGEAATWENDLDLGYGFTKLEDEGARKSDDRLMLVSQYGYHATKHLDYSAMLDFRTQFSDGFNYDKPDTPVLISRFLSPGVVKLGVGLTYKPVDFLEIFLAPVSNQVTIVLDRALADSGAFGVEPGKHIKSELGSQMNIMFEKELVENVALKSRFNAFAPYDDITTATITWESLLTFKVNNFINASIAADVLYDEDVPILRENGTEGPATQFREIFAIGVSYSFE